MYMTTINISLPTNMYLDAKKTLSNRGYASISELVRDALRGFLYPRITENGFTPEFEKMVLEGAKESVGKAKEWISARDIDSYFKNLKKKTSAHDKNQKNR